MSADPSSATDQPVPATVEPPAAPAPAPAAEPVAWPDWFPMFDKFLAVMAVVLAFLVSSFVARNADFWRHVAAGRLVAKFQYPVGGDPFTYTAAERVWVNPNWVSEVVLYALYAADPSGAIAVGVKAIAFAAAFGLLFLLRKPAFPLWPWAAAAAVAVVGGCSQTHLRPYVFGLLMLSVTLLVLFRGNWTAGNKWRMPLALGGVTAVWANVDAFAFLAPAAVALLLAGEWVHGVVMAGAEEPAPADDPFPAVPPPPALGRALGVCVVALLLNPTFLAAAVRDPAEAVAQLVPFELDFGTAGVLAADADLAKSTNGALRPEYLQNPLYGKNPSGAFAAAVAVLGVLLSAADYRGGRVSHLALWLGFALAAGLLHARFLGPLMVVSVPFLAAHLNSLTRRLDLTKLSGQTARTLVTACRAGRVATAFGLVLLGILAWPGWLQIHQPNWRALDRWVAWGAEPEAGMKRAAETLQGWRADAGKADALADTRGLFTGPEFGDYCAWFGPAEKAFLNTRYRLHRAELPNLITLRKARSGKLAKADPADRPVAALMDKYKAGYLCVGQPYDLLTPEPVLRAQVELTDPDSPKTAGHALWHLDGRFAVVGRTDTPDGVRRAGVMAWDAARATFGPAPPRAADPEPDLRPAPATAEGWQYDFLVRPKVTPVEVDDSLAYSSFAEQRRGANAAAAQEAVREWTGAVPGVYALGGIPAGWAAERAGPPRDRLLLDRPDFEFALPVLAVRAARRATRDTADPRAFLALAFAYEGMPTMDPREKRMQVVTAYTRALARYPDEVEEERSRHTGTVLQIRCLLLRQHLRGESVPDQNLDLAGRLAEQVNKQARAATDEDVQRLPVPDLWADWLRALAQALQAGVPPEARVSDAVMARVFQENPLLSPAQLGQLNEQANAAAKAGQTVPDTVRGVFLKQLVFDHFARQGVLDKKDDLTEWLNDTTPLTVDVYRQRLRRLEESIKGMVQKLNEEVDRLARGRSPEDKFQAYIAYGLPDKAIEVMEEVGDKSKAGSITLGQSLKLIGVLQKVGRLEDAHYRRKELEAELAGQSGDGDPALAALRDNHRLMELTEAKLAGDFKKADVLHEELFRSQALPPLTAAERKQVTARVGEVTFGVGTLGGGWPCYLTFNALNNLRGRLQYEADYWYERGTFALLDGDTKRAKEFFDEAAAPQGVPLKELEVSGQMQRLGVYLPKYRELLDRYAK